jgi:AcrR family transcriptional regulator
VTSLPSGDRPGDRPAVGLRERKKAKTRAAIQQHALRLFREQGYAETTVDQIAEAAEISPSTFFRYFATKEDVVIQDQYDPLMIAAFKAQPPDVSPVQAVREAMISVFGSLSEQEWAEEVQRQKLIAKVPELQAAALRQVAAGIEMLAAAAAERAGRRPDDLAVLAFAGAVVGVAIATMAAASAASAASPAPSARSGRSARPGRSGRTAPQVGDFATLFAAALDHLEDGLKL